MMQQMKTVKVFGQSMMVTVGGGWWLREWRCLSHGSFREPATYASKHLHKLLAKELNAFELTGGMGNESGGAMSDEVISIESTKISTAPTEISKIEKAHGKTSILQPERVEIVEKVFAQIQQQLGPWNTIVCNLSSP